MSEPRDAATVLSADPLGSRLARAAFEAATQGLLVLAPDGVVLAMNAAFGGIYGLVPSERVGRPYTEFSEGLEVHRLDGAVGPETWVTRRALSGERVEPVLQTIRLAHGPEFVARCGAVPLTDGGRLVATTITVEDVTEHVRAQQAVEGALSAAEVGTYRVDIQAGRIYGDANFARVYGVPEGAARGGPVSGVYDTIHPDDLPRVQAIVREATASGGQHEVEYRVVLSDGRVRWLLSRGRVEFDATGVPVQRIGSVMDVTGRRAAEEALRAQTARYEAVIGSERGLAEADGDYTALLGRAVEEAQRLTGADGACLEIQEGGEMVYEAACGMAEGFVGLRLPASGSLSGRTVDAGESSLCDDAETDGRVDRDACRRIGLRSMALVPLRYDRRGFGVLKVMAARPRAFSSAETQTLDCWAASWGRPSGAHAPRGPSPRARRATARPSMPCPRSCSIST